MTALTALGERAREHILERRARELLAERGERAQDTGREPRLDGGNSAADERNVGEDL
jgi:hypothetical protein